MEIESLAVALAREHYEIDAGIAAFTAVSRLRASLGSGELPEGWVCTKARPVTRNAGR